MLFKRAAAQRYPVIGVKISVSRASGFSYCEALIPWANVGRLDVLIAVTLDLVLATLLVELYLGRDHDLSGSDAFVINLDLHIPKGVADRTVASV